MTVTLDVLNKRQATAVVLVSVVSSQTGVDSGRRSQA